MKYLVLRNLEHNGTAYVHGDVVDMAPFRDLLHHAAGGPVLVVEAEALLESGTIIEADHPDAETALDGAAAAVVRGAVAGGHGHHGYGVSAYLMNDLDRRVARGQLALRQAAELRAHA